MTPEERADSVVGYLRGTGLPDFLLTNLKGRIVNEIRWAIEEALEEKVDVRSQKQENG